MNDLREVDQPIINDAFAEPLRHWVIVPGERPALTDGRREACYSYRPATLPAGLGTDDIGLQVPLELANRVRHGVRRWRADGYPGARRTTVELLEYWNNPERDRPLFFCQREAAESVIFLSEARADFLQGIDVPADEPGPDALAAGYRAFHRLACKMATGTGKTTVMAMVAAWSILNKVNDRTDRRFSDTVLVVCPNVTIRERLAELNPQHEGNLYRSRDLVPAHLMDTLRRGQVIVTNWHAFNPQDLNRVGGDAARVVKRGQESDTALARRVLGEAVSGKRNILVLNDEAHHAYRRRATTTEDQADDEAESDEEVARNNEEATLWIGGLDKVNRVTGINLCLDLSATPFYLAGTGNDPGRPFPWIISDFGLIDAIESGIVKIPQLPVQDATGKPIPAYFHLWETIRSRLTAAERGGRRGRISAEAVLRFAQQPIAQLAGLWGQTYQAWQEDAAAGRRDPVPPTFIVVCRDTAVARLVHEWLATGAAAPEFRNEPGRREYTVRIDSKVVEDLEVGAARDEESLRLRYVLGTIGRTTWREGSPPREWQDLVARLNPKRRDQGMPPIDPAVPPGRDVRCIVSVAMLTEGWDASNVTHIVGLRAFQSQLLCEQVVGRGLRRTQYQDLTVEEVACVYGVPFALIPFKATAGPTKPPERVHHVRALAERRQFEIRFPRVEGYRSAIRGRITVDWDQIVPLTLDPMVDPEQVRLKGLSDPRSGIMSLYGPGAAKDADLDPWRASHTLQELEFEMAEWITRHLAVGPREAAPPDTALPEHNVVPTQLLFLQVLMAVRRFVREKVRPLGRRDVKDVFLQPYFWWAVKALVDAMRPSGSDGPEPELPRYETHRGTGSTGDVDFWTAKDIWPAARSHVNLVVADTRTWEQTAAFYLDTADGVAAFVKNDHLGFAIPYLREGRRHDYIPDFLVRVQRDGRALGTLILEVKGYRDQFASEKAKAAERWVAAVNRDRSERACGRWAYHMVRSPSDVPGALREAASALVESGDSPVPPASPRAPHAQALAPDVVPAQPRRLV